MDTTQFIRIVARPTSLCHQAGNVRAMDQGRHARGEDYAAELPSRLARSNEVRLWLSVIAYNLGNLWRRLVLPKGTANWSLTSLQQRLVKTSGRLVKHALHYWLLLAESYLTRRLFGSVVRRIAALPGSTGSPKLR